LGELLKGRRRELGLRQGDLADLAGVSRRLVETVEQGVGSPRLASVLALCRALGLELVLRPGRGGLRAEDL
jgi:y4mF family transcriptional regulator